MAVKAAASEKKERDKLARSRAYARGLTLSVGGGGLCLPKGASKWAVEPVSRAPSKKETLSHGGVMRQEEVIQKTTPVVVHSESD